MTYTTADRLTVPQPVLRQIHRDSFFKSSEDRQVTLTVLEIRQPTFCTLTMTEVTDGYEVFAAEYLTGILALRLAEGWTIISGAERHYLLAPPEPACADADTMPVCSRCGSDRVIKDACARWDKATGRWILADVHSCAFCENCNAEGDALVQWVPIGENAEQRVLDADSPS